MDYFKKIERSVTISADKRSTVDLQVDVWSQDLNVTKFILKLDTTDSTAIDLTNATVRVAMVYNQDGQDVKIEAAGIVEDVATQKIAYIMDNRLAGFEGTVMAGFYVTLNTGQRIDIQNVTFNMRKSLLDKDLEVAKDSYYKTFDDIVADVQSEGEKSKTDIKAVVADVNGYSNLQKKTINDVVLDVQSMGDTQKEAINNVLTDVQSTADTVKADINAVLPTVNSYADTQKQAIHNIVDDVQSVGDTASQQVNDYATSIKSDMDNVLSDVQSKGSSIKSDMDTAKTSIDDYAITQKSDIDSMVADVNNHVITQKQAIDDVLTNVDNHATTQKQAIDSVVSDVESVGDTAKAGINAVLPTVNSYADTQKQAIHNIVDDVQSVGDTAKEDINAVLPSVQSQVSEIRTEIENIPDIPEVYTELADIKSYIGYTDSDIYGVEVDMVNRRFTRLAGAIGKNGGADFDNINAYKRRRCSVTNDGVVLAYYGEENYTESGLTTVEIVKNNVTYPVGTPVQAMVEQPKFYYKVVPLTVEPIANGKGYHMRKGRYYISDTPKAGFKVHPAFVQNGVVKEKIYLSAYEGSIFDTSANAYLLNDEQVADFSTDLLSSIANAKPCSGLTQNLTRANARLLAHNRGQGWEQQTIQTVSLTQLLFLIEYATFNMQDVLGMGATQKRDDGSTNMAEKTGSTTGLGNASGAVTNSNGTQIVSYRGEENPFGNIWKFVDGINVMAKNIHEAYVADHDFNDKQSAGSYTDVGFTLAKTRGYVSAFGYSQEFDWLFLTSETTGNSSVPVGDYFWQNYTDSDDGGWRTVRLGASWNGGSDAGGFGWGVNGPSVNRYRYLSGRLVYLGG